MSRVCNKLTLDAVVILKGLFVYVVLRVTLRNTGDSCGIAYNACGHHLFMAIWTLKVDIACKVCDFVAYDNCISIAKNFI
uniref:Uncharacterized protein n=1 Tax=Pararge aegeria TaxID=116150 RepID=S4PF83_9NEOP